jgi:Family of unknown function (DUF6516)
MLEEYLRQIEELLSTSPVVRAVEIVRRTVRDTALEKVLNYRYRVMLADGGFVEMTERVLEVQGTLEMTKYRHHAPHYPAIDTFPHHLHDGAEDRVVSHQAITGLEALQHILTEVEAHEISEGGEA